MNDNDSISIAANLRNAEIIVIGDVQKTVSSHKDNDATFYSINVHESLKGQKSAGSTIRLRFEDNDSETAGPILVPEKLYLFFLKATSDKDMPAGLYNMIDPCFGAIALDSELQDTGAVGAIRKEYGLDIQKMILGFKLAIRFANMPEDYHATQQAVNLFSTFKSFLSDKIEKADVVLIAEVDKIEPPYQVLGRWFYRIIPQEKIKGTLADNALIEIIYNRDSRWGRAPDPTVDMPFVFFLKAIHPADEAPKDLNYYHLVDYWKGMVAIDKMSPERRSVDEIMNLKGVDISLIPRSFIKMLQFCVEPALYQEAKDAVFVYNMLMNDFPNTQKR